MFLSKMQLLESIACQLWLQQSSISRALLIRSVCSNDVFYNILLVLSSVFSSYKNITSILRRDFFAIPVDRRSSGHPDQRMNFKFLGEMPFTRKFAQFIGGGGVASCKQEGAFMNVKTSCTIFNTHNGNHGSIRYFCKESTRFSKTNQLGVCLIYSKDTNVSWFLLYIRNSALYCVCIV